MHKLICEVCQHEMDGLDGDSDADWMEHVSTHVRTIVTKQGRKIDRHDYEFTHSVYSSYFGGWNGPGWYTPDEAGRRYTRIENVLVDLRNAVADVEDAMNGEILV